MEVPGCRLKLIQFQENADLIILRIKKVLFPEGYPPATLFLPKVQLCAFSLPMLPVLRTASKPFGEQ